MARPIIFDWEKIRNAYESGVPKNEICKEYKLKINTLNIKIRREGWVVNHKVSHAINNISTGLSHLAEVIDKSPELEYAIVERINTLLEDNELIATNRMLLKQFQSQILKGLKSGAFNKPADIKLGTSAIRDIESVANPKPEINIQNTNAVQNNVSIKVEWE